MKKTIVAIAMAGFSLLSWAQSTPAGLWRTIDDDGKTEKSLVRITEVGGVFSGKVEKITDPAKAAEHCEKCEGSLKGQPVMGMTILSGVRRDADDPTLYNGGEITDPANGKTYKVRMRTTDDGRKLDVRGYIGLPILGRTQTWLRAE